MTPMSGVATQQFVNNLPSCYSQTYHKCIADPNAYPGSQCKQWYDLSEGAYNENKEEYQQVIKDMPYCNPGYSLPVIAIAAVVGLVVGAIVL